MQDETQGLRRMAVAGYGLCGACSRSSLSCTLSLKLLLALLNVAVQVAPEAPQLPSADLQSYQDTLFTAAETMWWSSLLLLLLQVE